MSPTGILVVAATILGGAFLGVTDQVMEAGNGSHRSLAVGPEASLGGPVGGDSIGLAKNRYFPGEPLQGRFTASPYHPHDPWIGVIPSEIQHGSEEVADNHNLTFEPLKKRTEGGLAFLAPTKVGSYDVRMFNRDSGGGVELASVTFEVVGRE